MAKIARLRVSEQDTILMYFRAAGGDEITMKRLEKGAFILLAPPESGAPYVIRC